MSGRGLIFGTVEHRPKPQAVKPLPPAGWYVDYHAWDRLRYWDGEAWTRHVWSPALERYL